MNNSSMFTADRATHLKIVVVALIAATLVAGGGIAARLAHTETSLQASAPVLKTGKPVTSAVHDATAIR